MAMLLGRKHMCFFRRGILGEKKQLRIPEVKHGKDTLPQKTVIRRIEHLSHVAMPDKKHVPVSVLPFHPIDYFSAPRELFRECFRAGD